MVARLGFQFRKESAPTDRITLECIEQLLNTEAGGPVPVSVRQKEDKVYVKLTTTPSSTGLKPFLDTEKCKEPYLTLSPSQPDCTLL